MIVFSVDPKSITTAPTGAGVKIYGPSLQAADEPTTLYATVPADIAGSATFTDHHPDAAEGSKAFREKRPPKFA